MKVTSKKRKRKWSQLTCKRWLFSPLPGKEVAVFFFLFFFLELQAPPPHPETSTAEHLQTESPDNLLKVTKGRFRWTWEPTNHHKRGSSRPPPPSRWGGVTQSLQIRPLCLQRSDLPLKKKKKADKQCAVGGGQANKMHQK